MKKLFTLLTALFAGFIISLGGTSASAAELDIQKDLPSLKDYQKSIEKYNVKDSSKIDAFTVVTAADFEKVLAIAYKELPSQIRIKTSMDKKELNEIKDSWEAKTSNRVLPNVRTLANYSVKKTGTTFLLEDTSNKKYSAKSIEKGLNEFSALFASKLKGLDENQKLEIIYNYIFDNISYEAHGYQKMYVGNAYSTKIACNGYSHLFYKLATASGINAQIVFGGDHFWNNVVLANGQNYNVDITTDDLLKKRNYTLGASPEEHTAKVLETNLYTVEYIEDTLK